MESIVLNKDTDWGGNFKLHIESKTVEDFFNFYILRSIDMGMPIGFELQVPKTIDKFGNGVVFKSLGDTSDHFLQVLYSIYGLNSPDKIKFVNSISCNYVGLNDIAFKSDGQPRLKNVNYIKVFFEGADESEYAELFLNIDETNKTIEFEEKDFDYRPYVAMLLTAE